MCVFFDDLRQSFIVLVTDAFGLAIIWPQPFTDVLFHVTFSLI